MSHKISIVFFFYKKTTVRFMRFIYPSRVSKTRQNSLSSLAFLKSNTNDFLIEEFDHGSD